MIEFGPCLFGRKKKREKEKVSQKFILSTTSVHMYTEHLKFI